MIMTSVGLLLGLIICLLLGIPYIDFLKKKSIGQYIREVAPEAHAKKAGTPTTGGVFIIVSIFVSSIIILLMAQKLNSTSWTILLTLFFFALAGFQDDYLKIKGKENKGLSARGKLLRQIAIAMIPAIYVTFTYGTSVSFGYFSIDLGYLYPLLAVFIVTGASNAYNLTDGLDGLAASCGIPAFLGCAAIALISGRMSIAIISAVTVGALIGFLKYNKPKAEVFMGDTGSLAIGGLLGTLAIIGKFEIYLAFLAGIFVLETLSVILQVSSFKLTGKRIFKMSPIHHHFELLDWSEKRIVASFALTSLLFSIIAVLLFVLFYLGLV